MCRNKYMSNILGSECNFIFNLITIYTYYIFLNKQLLKKVHKHRIPYIPLCKIQV